MLTVHSLQGSPGVSKPALYLAAFWASTGRQVLLIEADPAGGSISHSLGIQFTPGSASFVASGLPTLSNHLIDHSQDVLFENLHIMPAPSSPTGARGIADALDGRAEALRMISENEMAVLIDGGRVMPNTASAKLTMNASAVVVVAGTESSASELEHLEGLFAADDSDGPKGLAMSVGKSPLTSEEWHERFGLTFCGSIESFASSNVDLSAFLTRNKRKTRKWRVSLEQVANKLYPHAQPPTPSRPRQSAPAEPAPAAEAAPAATISAGDLAPAAAMEAEDPARAAAMAPPPPQAPPPTTQQPITQQPAPPPITQQPITQQPAPPQVPIATRHLLPPTAETAPGGGYPLPPEAPPYGYPPPPEPGQKIPHRTAPPTTGHFLPPTLASMPESPSGDWQPLPPEAPPYGHSQPPAPGYEYSQPPDYAPQPPPTYAPQPPPTYDAPQPTPPTYDAPLPAPTYDAPHPPAPTYDAPLPPAPATTHPEDPSKPTIQPTGSFRDWAARLHHLDSPGGKATSQGGR